MASWTNVSSPTTSYTEQPQDSVVYYDGGHSYDVLTLGSDGYFYDEPTNNTWTNVVGSETTWTEQ